MNSATGAPSGPSPDDTNAENAWRLAAWFGHHPGSSLTLHMEWRAMTVWRQHQTTLSQLAAGKRSRARPAAASTWFGAVPPM